MKIEFSNIAQVMHDYLLWAWNCDAKEFEEFSKGKCNSVPFIKALRIYNEEVDYWLNAN